METKVKVSYGVGAVGKDLVYMLSSTYVLYYYQDILGMNAIFMGVLLLVARVFDAANDPVMGILVAKTKTRWGKFRPWLFSGTLLNALILFALFSTPQGLGGNMLKVYVAVMYILWGVTYTMMDIPYWSMIPAFTKSGKEREGLSQLARTCAGMGSAIITVVAIWAVNQLGSGNERKGFMWFSLIIAVIFVIAELITCINVKEKSTVDMETTSVKNMFKALFSNDQALIVVIAIVCINIALYITSNLVIYFFKYDIGGEGWYNTYTLFNTFGGAVQILSMALIYPLMRKILSTINVFYVCIAMASVGYVVLLTISCLNMDSLVMLLVPAFFIFAANGMLCVLTTVFLANSVDYGELKNGRRDESVIFSMQTFVYKLASGVAVLIASICISTFNISKDTSEEAVTTILSNSASMGLRLTMTVLPMLILIIAVIVFSKKFVLTEKKVDEIIEKLKARKQNENVIEGTADDI